MDGLGVGPNPCGGGQRPFLVATHMEIAKLQHEVRKCEELGRFGMRYDRLHARLHQLQIAAGLHRRVGVGVGGGSRGAEEEAHVTDANSAFIETFTPEINATRDDHLRAAGRAPARFEAGRRQPAPVLVSGHRVPSSPIGTLKKQPLAKREEQPTARQDQDDKVSTKLEFKWSQKLPNKGHQRHPPARSPKARHVPRATKPFMGAIQQPASRSFQGSR